MNILIVDDDKINIKLVKSYLGLDKTNKIFDAENGLEAIQMLETISFDLLLIDLMMPMMNGFELISELKKNHPTTPFIVISGAITPQTIEKVVSLGANDWIKKPYYLEELNFKVQRFKK